MFRMMRAVPRMASLRQATIKSQTVKSVNHKASISPLLCRDDPDLSKYDLTYFSSQTKKG